jgi:hypothetical protein
LELESGGPPRDTSVSSNRDYLATHPKTAVMKLQCQIIKTAGELDPRQWDRIQEVSSNEYEVPHV